MSDEPNLDNLTALRATTPERYSVQARADNAPFAPTSDVTGAGLFWVQLGNQIDDEPRYNPIYPHWRDVYLRNFARSEPMLASAVYSMATRVSGLNYTLNGPPRAKKYAQELLLNPGLGDTLISLIQKLVTDLHTADNGAFVELWRPGNPNTDAGTRPVVGFAQLDSRQCWRSFDPEFPVWYTNPITSEIRKIHRSRVVFTADNPQPQELGRGLGFCATSRVLRMTRVFKNMQIFVDEKVGGRFTRALGSVSGVTPQQLKSALASNNETADAKGFVVYKDIPFLVSPNMEKGSEIKIMLQDLASLPDGFVFRDDADLYAYILAFAFGVDAREFWPATSTGATKADATVQNMKAQGRGLGNDIQLIEGLLRAALPASVSFEFDNSDDEADKMTAEIHQAVANVHKTYVDMGAISAMDARALGIAQGILDASVLANNSQPVDSDDNPDTPDNSSTGNTTPDGTQPDAAQTDVTKQINSAFVYVALPNDAQILEIQNRVRNVLGINGIEYQKPDTFHVTMLYCNHATDEQLQNIIASSPIGKSMKIVSNKLGMFTNGDERALYLEIERDDNLITLQNNVYQTFVNKGMASELSPFSAPGGYNPHITLAYLPKGVDIPNISINLSTSANRYVFGRDDYKIVTSKNYATYRRSARNLTRGLWLGDLSPFDFVDGMVSAITREFNSAWSAVEKDYGVLPGERPLASQASLDLAINSEISYLTGFADAIVKGSKANGGIIEPLLDRADMWANGYDKTVELAKTIVGGDKKFRWVRNPFKDSCPDCIQYDGMVFFGSQWAAAGVRPKSWKLACHGVECGCSFQETVLPKTYGDVPPLIGHKPPVHKPRK